MAQRIVLWTANKSIIPDVGQAIHLDLTEDKLANNPELASAIGDGRIVSHTLQSTTDGLIISFIVEFD
ncbi:hypothetical protein [Nocardia gamkensis]|uniref:Uncharacterized protein n=1 Tax=Nocardia gamkensis TaxID=352869 RepID=A0A7X6R5K1_9NOCA|nr:hypothetical protein [Nocardia gamkensis]NKY29437.1 hypothetical protein [Nocardia gamkensis]NQE66962.1 hypothetical protein [Nocardia gamkensis]